MRSLIKIVALALLTVGLCCVQPVELRAQEQTATAQRAAVDTQKLAAIVDWLKADVEKGRIPGAVVLVARAMAKSCCMRRWAGPTRTRRC